MNALSTITLLPCTPNERKVWIDKAIQELLEGKYYHLDIHARITMFEKLIDELKKHPDYKANLIAIVDTATTAFGFDFKTVEKKTYDFAACGDNEWDNLDLQIKRLTDRRKERENFLKTLKKPIADAESGDIINPPAFTTSEYVKCEKSKI